MRERFPDVPGRADYCVYWFRRAYDELPARGRAGLVGTNTIRQNYSREGGLDYIVQSGGTITEAVSTQVWSGDSAVHVSIANWIKGTENGLRKLYTQTGDRIDSPWQVAEVENINSALSASFDVTTARPLTVNSDSDTCLQGQTHGHEGFARHKRCDENDCESDANREVIFPYLTADDLLGSKPPVLTRCVIDFQQRDLFEGGCPFFR